MNVFDQKGLLKFKQKYWTINFMNVFDWKKFVEVQGKVKKCVTIELNNLINNQINFNVLMDK